MWSAVWPAVINMLISLAGNRLSNATKAFVLPLEKIWHENLTDLPTSPVRCSHFTMGKPKEVVLKSSIRAYF